MRHTIGLLQDGIALDGGVLTKDPNADSIGWYCQNSSSITHPVGKKAANAWGLYDMAGNVSECCHDGYQTYLGSSAVVDPIIAGGARVMRGGSWSSYARRLRAARRDTYPLTARIKDAGFRCVRTIIP